MGINRRQYLFSQITAADPTKNTQDVFDGDLEETYHSMVNAGTIPSGLTTMPAGVAALSSSNTRFVNANANSILRSWYAALGNRKAKRANVVCIGDSLTLGYGASAFNNRWVNQLAILLRSRLGLPVGGRGYVGSIANNSVSSFTWPTTVTGGGTASADYGLKRDTQSVNGTTTVAFNLNGTSADIVYPTDPSYGTFSWKVDAGAATNISPTAASSDGTLTRVSLGAAGAHTLTISAVSGASYLDGVIEYNGDENSGVMVHDAGHGGYRVSDWLAGSYDSTKNWPNAIKAISPDLLVISLGTNDIASISASVFQTNLLSFRNLIRGFLPNVPIVFASLQAPWQGRSLWNPYVQAMAAVAVTDGNAVVADLSQRMSSYSDANNYGTWYDQLHPNDLGHQMIADNLASFLLP